MPLFHLARRSREIKERDGVYPPCSLLASTSRSVSITKSCEITGRLSPAARPPVIFVVPCSTHSLSPSLPPSFHLCPFTDGSHSWTKRGALSADQNEGWKEREREKGRVEKKKDTSPLFEQARVNTGVRQNRTGKARELQTDTSIFMSRFPFHVSSSSPDD